MPRSNILPIATAMLALMALGGCGKHDSGNAAAGTSSPADATKNIAIAAASTHPQAGRWEATVKFNHIDMPGMSPQMLDAMQRGMAAGAPVATCLTAERAARPAAEFFSGRHHSCVYDNFTMADGNLNAVMHCSGASSNMKMTLTGTYDQTHYDMHSIVSADMPGGRSMTQDMNVTSKWVGPCTGSEVNAGSRG